MGGSNLSVKITADVVDLQTKFAVARAEVNGLTSEMNKLARATAAGTIDPGGAARLQQVAGDMLRARGEAAQLSGALAATGVSFSGMGAAAGESHLAIGMASREIRALATELSRGEIALAPITIARLAHSLLGVSPMMLLAIAGAAGLTAGLGYLIYKVVEASNALDKIEISAAFAGNLDITRDAIKQFADEMSQGGSISASASREVIAAFANMRDLTLPELHALTAVVTDFATATGEKAPKAAEELARMFSQSESAQKFAESIGGVTQSQINMATDADKSGDAQEIFASKLELLRAALERAAPKIDEHNAGILSSFSNYLKYVGLMAAGENVEQAQTDMLEVQNAARAKQVSLLQQSASDIMAMPRVPEQVLKTGVATAEAENPVAKQIENAKSKIKEMNDALAVAQQRGDSIDVATLNAGLIKAHEQLSSLEFGPALERMREQMGQVAATWDGTQSGMLEKQRAIAVQELGQVQAGSKEYLAVQQEVARLDVQIRQTAGAELIALARTQISNVNAEVGIGGVQRLEKERDIWQQLLTSQQLTNAQRLDVERSYNNSVAALNKQRQQESEAIARQDADATIAIGRMNIEAKKSEIESELSTVKAGYAQRYAALKELTQQEFALDLQGLQAELSALKNQPVEYDRVYNQIRELRAKLAVDLAALDRQETAAAASAAKQQAQDWKSVVGEIEGAESGMVADLINKRRSLSASLLQIGSDLITKEIANDLKAVTTRILLAQEGDTAQKALEQGGYLYHLAMQVMKTGATAAQQTAQNSAVASGLATQQTEIAAAAAAGRAVQATTGPAQVMADAAVAAAGSFASVAAIPYVGWAMAPGVAEAAFAQVSAYAPLASLAEGAWGIPREGLYHLHEGERVTPEPYARGMEREGGGGDTNHNYGGNTIHVGDNTLRRALQNRGTQREFVKMLATAYRRGARP